MIFVSNLETAKRGQPCDNEMHFGDSTHMVQRGDSARRVWQRAGAGGLLAALTLTVMTGWVDWQAVGSWLRSHALVTVMAVGAVLLLASAWIEWSRSRAGTRRPQRARPPLNWWTIAAAGTAVAAVTWGATVWLLTEADRAIDPAAARVEAIKTGLGLGAGTGAVFALLLAVRRQWHQEVSALDTAHDATERRVTELYTKAVEQLGSKEAPVRLGGLYALERLAQDNISQRQSIVNILCAYLRLPYESSLDSHSESVDERLIAARQENIQEREVRQAVQDILCRHLLPGNDSDDFVDTYWKDTDIDLTGANLIEFSFTRCRVRTATFTESKFTGTAWFNEVQFDDEVRFTDAEFADYVSFDKARLDDKGYFIRTKFSQAGVFDNVRFNDSVSFDETWFGDFASFLDAQFADVAKFKNVQVQTNSWFERVRFDGIVSFDGARFGDLASFDYTQFTDSVSFDKAKIAGLASFKHAQFDGPASFNDVQFLDHSWFQESKFGRTATFRRAIFCNDTSFEHAHLVETASFGDVLFKDVDFDVAKFESLALFSDAAFTGHASFDRTQFSGLVMLDPRSFTSGVPAELTRFIVEQDDGEQGNHAAPLESL
jgi:uncharacterized protein YjbI with pentapeptide repeats